ncbi:hypothetical protein [Rathayibacter rathayi]|uniref:hypothetical protein n=1 Tax=Rathayibacter rathayi TaxID=33887 RepID=UPI0015E27122|nr:hypothetical protein [Rathayibacter rathayi]
MTRRAPPSGPGPARRASGEMQEEKVLLHQLERSSLVLPGADSDELACALRALGARVCDALA